MTRDRLQYIKSYIDSGPDIKGTVMYFILDEVVTALEAAWEERGDAIKERGFLSSQNSELIEDIAAITLERDELRETVKVLSERLADMAVERDALQLRGAVCFCIKNHADVKKNVLTIGIRHKEGNVLAFTIDAVREVRQ